jgi:hypothetical protein
MPGIDEDIFIWDLCRLLVDFVIESLLLLINRRERDREEW